MLKIPAASISSIIELSLKCLACAVQRDFKNPKIFVHKMELFVFVRSSARLESLLEPPTAACYNSNPSITALSPSGLVQIIESISARLMLEISTYKNKHTHKIHIFLWKSFT